MEHKIIDRSIKYHFSAWSCKIICIKRTLGVRIIISLNNGHPNDKRNESKTVQ